jgi:hypothetical protein
MINGSSMASSLKLALIVLFIIQSSINFDISV